MPLLLAWSMEGKEWFLWKPVKVNDKKEFLRILMDMCRGGILEVGNMSEFAQAVHYCFDIDLAMKTLYQRIREDME